MNESPAKAASSVPLRTSEIVACAFFGVVLLAYAGLTALGRWSLDEYSVFYTMRGQSPYLLKRLTWSPRPASEAVYSCYAWLVNHFHHEFIVPFLALLWAVWIVAGLVTFWQRRRELRSASTPIFALSLMALTLAGGHTTEVFYWPAGAVAYIPTLAAILLLFLQIVDGKLDTPRGRLLAAICLTIAAASSEAGATFVLCYTAIQLLRQIIAGIRSRNWRASRPRLWYVVPLLVTLVVLTIVRLNRFETNEGMPTASNAIAGHPVKSLIAGGEEIVIEFVGRTMLRDAYEVHHSPMSWLHSGILFPLHMLVNSRFAMEILLVGGMALYWSRFERPSQHLVRRILEAVAALFLASLFTAAAANLHFGQTCCERHELLRESWMVMILAGLTIACMARVANQHRQWLAKHAAKAPLLLCLAVVALGPIGRLVRTYRLYPALVRANQQNLDSGFRNDRAQMSFWVLPSVGIIEEEPVPTGFYARPKVISGFSYAVYPLYLLGFFDKQRVTVCPLDFTASAAGRLPDTTCPTP